MLIRLAVIFLFFLQANSSFAATIEVQRLDGAELDFIFVDGEFVEGDSRKFSNIAISLDAAIVIFNSPGGLIEEGLAIGRAIYIKRFNTAVGKNSICASACGLAWLAGREKFVFPTSQIGFHAIYTDPGSNMRISSAGNALVGAYLQQLGFNEELIVYATDIEPTSMQWLTGADAERFRLNVTLIENDVPAAQEEQVAAYSLPDVGPLPQPRPPLSTDVAESRLEAGHDEQLNEGHQQEESYTEFDYLFGNSIERLFPGFSKKFWRVALPDIYLTYIGILDEYDPRIGNYTFIFGYDETDRLYDVCSVSRYYDRRSSLFISCKIGGERLLSIEGDNIYLDGMRLFELTHNASAAAAIWISDNGDFYVERTPVDLAMFSKMEEDFPRTYCTSPEWTAKGRPGEMQCDNGQTYKIEIKDADTLLVDGAVFYKAN